MRLLHTKKTGLQFEEFYGDDIPPYAILSHTWYGNNQEPSYQDICNGTGQDLRGYEKILKCKELAIEYDYFWVDTCCIDKCSSAELTEAINSMYMWYQRANTCFVYLSDVPPNSAVEIFEKSRWFTRGWTLQELIEPVSVTFYAQDWTIMEEKRNSLEVLGRITGIPQRLLCQGCGADQYSVAERLSWASNRTTTRIEDQAYSLMGLFGVNMPLLYGEGGKAFRRLQEEIMKITCDQTIFAWEDSSLQDHFSGLLATSPRCFAKSKNLISMSIWGKGSILGATNRGLRAKFYMIGSSASPLFTASLDCWVNDKKDRTIGIQLHRLVSIDTAHDTGHVPQFARANTIMFDLGLEDKVGGRYEGICVQETHMTADLLRSAIYDEYRWYRYIHIRDPGRPFTVYPSNCWERQTGIFTASRNVLENIGVVCIPGNECDYVVYFGISSRGDHWVKADFRALKTSPFNKDDVGSLYQPTEIDTFVSKIEYKYTKNGTSHTERLEVRSAYTWLLHTSAYEITMAVTQY